MNPDDAYSKSFAEIYDIITGHKCYDLEVAALTGYLRSRVGGGAVRLLDLGCGTGTHAIRLSREGFDVTGIDISGDMISVAKSKESDVRFHCVDARDLGEGDFRCVTSLFNVVNCLPTYDELLAFLRAARERMVDGGIIVVEAWNAVAVIAEPPTVVCREYSFEGGLIRREVTPECDFMNQSITLSYSISVDGEPARLVRHPITLFMPWEIAGAMAAAGFSDVVVRSALPSLQQAGSSDRMLAVTAVAAG
ncbi:methyltransferase domain-containing protein [Akkermansiaceae bacterium]|nr:methyltransferase domain-containing protein [Akkermansiaceae bacterium]